MDINKIIVMTWNWRC